MSFGEHSVKRVKLGFCTFKGPIQTLFVMMLMHSQSCNAASSSSLNSVKVREGDSLDLICCIESNVSTNSYYITTPDKKSYPVFNGSVFENGNIRGIHECCVNIKNITMNEEGIWEFATYVQRTPNTDTSTIRQLIELIVLPRAINQRILTESKFKVKPEAAGVFIGILLAIFLGYIIYSRRSCIAKALSKTKASNYWLCKKGTSSADDKYASYSSNILAIDLKEKNVQDQEMTIMRHDVMNCTKRNCKCLIDLHL